MNESLRTTNMEQSLDSRFFSQRAKYISSLNEQTPPVIEKPSLTKMHFQFSNRTYMSNTQIPTTPIGRGHGNVVLNESRQNINAGRGRTTIPLSSFVLQKDTPSLSSSTSTMNTISSPIFVMHDEVQFVRPYFGPRSNNHIQSSSSVSNKREVLLSALKQIETGLKTL